MTSTLLLLSNRQSCMGFRCAYLHLTLIYFKGQDQGHEHLNCKYLKYIVNILKMMIDMVTILLSSTSKSCITFQLEYLHLTLTNSMGQGQDEANFDSEYLGNVDESGKHYYCRQIASDVWTFDWHIYM